MDQVEYDRQIYKGVVWVMFGEYRRDRSDNMVEGTCKRTRAGHRDSRRWAKKKEAILNCLSVQ